MTPTPQPPTPPSAQAMEAARELIDSCYFQKLYPLVPLSRYAAIVDSHFSALLRERGELKQRLRITSLANDGLADECNRLSGDSERGSIVHALIAQRDELKTSLARVEGERDALKTRQSPRCSCCAGEGVPVSGLKCICGGAGTQEAELQGFREHCYTLRAELAAKGEESMSWRRTAEKLKSQLDDAFRVTAGLSARASTNSTHP